MKSKLFSIFIITMLILTMVSCKKTGCSDFNDAEISWTEYNTVSQVFAYFTNKKRADSHIFDTVRIQGYALDFNDSTYYSTEYYSNLWPGVLLTDNPNEHTIHSITIVISGDTTAMSWLKEYKFGQQLRLTGFCHADDPGDEYGCGSTVGMTPIEVEINNQNGTTSRKLVVQ